MKIFSLLLAIAVFSLTDACAQDSNNFAQLQKAADWGDKEAAYRLAEKYEVGDGVARDLQKADYWYSQSGRRRRAKAGAGQTAQISSHDAQQVSSAWQSISGTVRGWGASAQKKMEAWQTASEQYFKEHPEMQQVVVQGVSQAIQNYMNGGSGASGSVTAEQASDAGRTLQQYQAQQSK